MKISCPLSVLTSRLEQSTLMRNIQDLNTSLQTQSHQVASGAPPPVLPIQGNANWNSQGDMGSDGIGIEQLKLTQHNVNNSWNSNQNWTIEREFIRL